jgi:hypothetical protein
MSMLFRTRIGEPRQSGVDDDTIFDHWEPRGGSPYLTDGVRLYRYVGGVPRKRGELVALEDCASLKILLFEPDELRALTLRSVVPADREQDGEARPGVPATAFVGPVPLH